MQSIKILHTGQFSSEGNFGAEALVIDLAQHHKANGIEVEIMGIAKNNTPNLPIVIRAQQANITASMTQMHYGIDIKATLKIIQYAKEHEINIIHLHGYKAIINFGIIPQKYRENIALVATQHGITSPNSLKQHLVWRVKNWLEGISIYRLDAIAYVNQRLAKTHQKPFVTQNTDVYTITNGITPTPPSQINSNNNSKAIESFFESGFIIGAAGRLSKEKDHMRIVRAFSTIEKKHTNIKLIIFGNGPMEKSIKNLIESLGLTNKILLTGYIEQAAYWFKYLDIFILSSLSEGSPISILEAMRAQTPIITTDVGDVTQRLTKDKHAIIISSGNTTALSEAINKLYNNPQLCKQLKANAYQHFMENCTTEKTANAYADIYFNCLKSKLSSKESNYL